jgi:hypothetical protein
VSRSVPNDLECVIEASWRKVKDFDDFLIRESSNFNINIEGHFTEQCGPEACDFSLDFSLSSCVLLSSMHGRCMPRNAKGRGYRTLTNP